MTGADPVLMLAMAQRREPSLVGVVDPVRECPDHLIPWGGTVKRLLTTLSVTVGLTVAALPATAATVDGFNYNDAGLRYLSESCSGVLNGPSANAAALYRSGGDSGTHATGYDVTNSANLFGAETYVSTPNTLQSISFATYHPQGPDADTNADGYFRAIYDEPGTGFWVGYRSLDVTQTGWGTWSNYATADLTWYSVPGTLQAPGTPAPDDRAASIKTLPGVVGSGGGAYVGFGFGCNGRDFYADDFRVRTSTRNSVYDFEGIRSASYISSNPSHHSTHLHKGLTSLRLIEGQDHYLLAHSESLTDDVYTTRGYLTGSASLYAKSYGDSKWRRVGSEAYYPEYGYFRIKPKRQTQYQIRTTPVAGLQRDTWESSTSKTLTVSVERRMKARADSKKVRKGQAVHVTGRVFPKDKGVKVTLQRKVGNKWKKIGKAKTKKKGKYSVSGRASSTGKWQVRVKVAKAKGNVGNVSPSIEIKVLKPRKPAPVQPVSVQNDIPDVHYPDDGGIDGRRPGGPTRALPLGSAPEASNGGVLKPSMVVVGTTPGQVAKQR